MNELRALSLHQPWASLCVPLAPGEEPVKTIETRDKPLKYRGRLLIHSAKRVPAGGAIGDFYVEPWYDDVQHLADACYCEPDGITPECGRRGTRHQVLSRGVTGERVVSHLPLGAIVGSCELVDVVPIVHAGEESAVRRVEVFDDSLWLSEPDEEDENGEQWGEEETREISDQLPYGDFTPGRYAYILEDAKRTDERCPACWACDEEVGPAGERCGSIRFVPWDEDPSQRLCLECGHVCAHAPCSVCHGKGSCPPIPAKGKQGLWRPDSERVAS